jgi:hypothetical protein
LERLAPRRARVETAIRYARRWLALDRCTNGTLPVDATVCGRINVTPPCVNTPNVPLGTELGVPPQAEPSLYNDIKKSPVTSCH